MVSLDLPIVGGDDSTWGAKLNTAFTTLTGQLLPTTYRRFRSRKAWGLGDSLTAGAPVSNTFDAGVFSNTQQGGLLLAGTTWPTWALLASGTRWTFAGFAATPGYTAAQILTTHVPQILAAATPGDTIVVLAGTNGNVFADVKTIHDTLRLAGLHTVAVTIPPSTSSTLANVAAFNTQLKDYAQRNDIPLVDGHAALVDPTTGAYLAALNLDGVHPNGLGFQALGQAIATCLNTLMPPGLGDLVDHNAAYAGNLQTKPLATGAVSGTDYAPLAALGTSTIAPATKAAFAGGQGLLFTRGDTDINARLGLYTFIAGHRYRIGAAINFQLGAAGTLSMRLESNTTGLKIPWGLGYTTPLSALNQADSRFYSEFVMPSGLPDYTYRLRIVLTAAGSTLALGELTIFDLTALGLT